MLRRLLLSLLVLAAPSRVGDGYVRGGVVRTVGQGQVHSLQVLPLLRPLREAGRYVQHL
jgi:hypothetical protein